MQPPEFKTLPLAAIVTSLTNPRKTFSNDKLQELAESIKASGVHQPVLVRPLPGSRVPDTTAEVEYELVVGERRFRASQMAGTETIPALVRELTDAQVIEIQVIENLQREDLPPLEEAEGYQALMDTTGITMEELPAKVGRSRTTVYSRLKLLDLCADAKTALREGKLDASRAELIARIPDEKLQLKALAEFTATEFNGDARMGYRACRAWITKNVMLRLEAASFNPSVGNLCHGVGPCSACPKRTGANPDLFNDIEGPDLCTDPACFHAKEAAHLERELEARRKKGVATVDESEIEAHTELDKAVPLPDGSKPTVAELMNEFMSNKERKTATKAGVIGGQVVSLVSDEVVANLQAQAREKAKAKTAPAGKGNKETTPSKAATDHAAAQQKMKLEDQYEGTWRTKAVAELKPRLLAGALSQFEAPVLRKLLTVVLEGQDWPIVFAALDLPNNAGMAEVNATLASLPDTELGPRICLAIALEEAHELRRTIDGDLTSADALQHLATSCGVDVAAIQAEVQEAMRAEHATPAKPGKSGGTPPKGKGAKGKLSQAAASAAIATALQQAEGGAGGALQPVDAWPFPDPDKKPGGGTAADAAGEEDEHSEASA
jgi:ParB/RepB/Spo0J family partition protein